MTIVRARAVWERLETIHAVTYFATESRDAAKQAGLKGFWMGYFGFRAAPMGSADAATVAAAFANFSPAMVERAIPDAWEYASPDSLVGIRSAVAAAALRRLVPSLDDHAAALLPTLTAVAAAATPAGPLSEANRAVPRPADPLGHLWQLTTLLREHRGDHHVRLLRDAGIDGCESHQLHAAEHGTPHDLLRDNRGWTKEEWAAAEARLADRGLLVDRRLTADGLELRRAIEAETDRRSAEPLDAALGAGAQDDLLAALQAPAAAIAGSGVIPYPNPMGLPALDAG